MLSSEGLPWRVEGIDNLFNDALLSKSLEIDPDKTQLLVSPKLYLAYAHSTSRVTES